MLQSLFSGITGLTVASMSMSVLGDNIANVSTNGFKKSTPIFQDLLAQSVAGRSAGSQVGLGATTGAIWKDFSQGAISNSTRDLDLAINGDGFFVLQNVAKTDGTISQTNRYYSRQGHFDLDNNGYVVNPNGYILQGWAIDSATGSSSEFGNIQITDDRLSGNATTEMNLSINLDPNESAHTYYIETDQDFGSAGVDFNQGASSFTFSIGTTGYTVAFGASTAVSAAVDDLNAQLGSAAVASYVTDASGFTEIRITPSTDWAIENVSDGTGNFTAADIAGSSFDSSAAATYDYTTTVTCYDTQGNSHPVNVYFRKDAEGKWQWFAESNEGVGPFTSGLLEFDTQGDLVSPTVNNLPSATFRWVVDPTTGNYTSQDIQLNFADPDGAYGSTSQNGNSSVTNFISQDGYAPGALEYIEIDAAGVVTGQYSNGELLELAQVALARFDSPQGLEREGSSMYVETRDSGEPTINPAEEGGSGSIYSNAVEESNADIATEFVAMIMAQRAFQANAKVISTSDQMLGELMNLRR